MCHACWSRLDRRLRNQPVQNEQVQNIPVQDQPVEEQPVQDQVQLQPSFVTPRGYKRASNTARHCIFTNCRNVVAHNVPLYAKFQLLHNHNFYIPELARVCNAHFMRNDWVDLLNTTSHENFDSTHVVGMMNLYKWGIEQRSNLDFKNIEEIEDNEFHFWTGLTKYQFNVILNQTPSLGDRSVHPATVLGIFLTKIRTGEPDERLATKFNMSRRTLERKLAIARECLSNDFVPQHLGLNHITREDVVAKNLAIPSHFFGGNYNEPAAILVCDGTYIYLQKSSNFLFQRKTYSLHKFRNLVKPFLIVCTDGYIVDVTGPYTATTSDASIMRDLMQEDSPIHGFLRVNDVFILDRGFRDSIDKIEECGYNPHMPPTRVRGEQLTTLDANKSRLITMIRWVVETINGRFKKDFKIFRHVYFNVAMRNMMVDFKITAAIINATRHPYEDHMYAEQFIRIINERMNEPNEMAEYVINHNLNRQRVAFVRLDGNDPDFDDFPRLTFDELILFTLGSYHLRIARSYCHEHMREDGVYTIELYRHQEMIENKILIRGRIQSRHVRAKQYYTYILVDPTHIGRNSIQQYYCSCIHGRRTVGSCAHVVSVVYFLSWARHQDVIDAPAAFLDELTIDFDNAE